MHDRFDRLTLHQLRVFRAVARERNFTKAAAQMGLTQSAVSVQIRDLGAILGAPLFDVLGKSLTIRGYVLFEFTPDRVQLDRAEQFIASGVSSGKLVPVIAKTFPLDQIVEAHRYLESNAQVGKVVVTV